MPTVILPDKWLKQPTGPVCLDPTHWAYPALVFALCPTDDGAQAQFRQRDLVSGQYLTNYGVDIGPTSDGVALAKTSSAWDRYLWLGDSPALSTPKMLVVTRVSAASGAGDGGPIHKRNVGGNGWNLHVKFAALTSNNYPVFCFYDGVAWRQAQGTADIRGTGWHTLVGSYDGATVRLAVDGTVSSSSFTGSIPDTAATLKLCGDGETGGGPATTLAYILDGAKIANHEIAVRELASAPWSVFKRDRRRLYIIPAAGGAYTLTAGSGSFSLTGTAATLKVGRVLSCGSGSFALSGTAATLKSGKVLAAASGSYALTGTAATLKAGRLLSAASGTYAVSGTAADLRKSAILAATSGSFALTGTAATLTYTPAGSYSLSADSGSYTLNGTTVALKVGRILPAASGSYAFTGTNVTLSRGRTMAAASGSFALTGTNISFARSYVLTASSGSFALSGSDVSLTYSGAPVVVPPTTGGGGGPMIIKERGLRDELARIRKEREEAALRRQIQREDEEIVLIMAALAA